MFRSCGSGENRWHERTHCSSHLPFRLRGSNGQDFAVNSGGTTMARCNESSKEARERGSALCRGIGMGGDVGMSPIGAASLQGDVAIKRISDRNAAIPPGGRHPPTDGPPGTPNPSAWNPLLRDPHAAGRSHRHRRTQSCRRSMMHRRVGRERAGPRGTRRAEGTGVAFLRRRSIRVGCGTAGEDCHRGGEANGFRFNVQGLGLMPHFRIDAQPVRMVHR